MQIRLGTGCPIDPRADLPGFLTWHRSTFGDFRMEDGEGDEGGSSGDGDGEGGSDEVVPGRDFPEGTPRSEMTPEQEIAYWKHLAKSREKDLRAASTDPAEVRRLRKEAAEATRLRKERETESERAIREVRENAEAEANLRAAPRLVAAEFRAAAKGVLTTEQRDALLEDLDLTKYLTDKGEVDVDKVERKVAAFAPKDEGDGKGKRKLPDLGQGRRGGETKSKGAAGAAEAQRRFAKTQ